MSSASEVDHRERCKVSGSRSVTVISLSTVLLLHENTREFGVQWHDLVSGNIQAARFQFPLGDFNCRFLSSRQIDYKEACQPAHGKQYPG